MTALLAGTLVDDFSNSAAPAARADGAHPAATDGAEPVANCCIVFLMPSYLAIAVKGRRWRLPPLTLAFAAGLAVVLVPVTLGVRLLASTLTPTTPPSTSRVACSCWHWRR